jgi:hypothetical protein
MEHLQSVERRIVALPANRDAAREAMEAMWETPSLR